MQNTPEYYFDKGKNLLLSYPSMNELHECIMDDVRYYQKSINAIDDFDLIERTDAIKYLKVASKYGHAEASYYLALFYGISNLSSHHALSMNYLKSSTVQGYGKASYELAHVYLDGRYIEKNIYKSAKLLKLSASQNFKLAYSEIGYNYLNGKNGFDKNIDSAIAYFEVASVNGDIYATVELMALQREGLYYDKDDNCFEVFITQLSNL